MSASLACNPRQMTGYSLEQLASAFDRVRNPRDWQGPIRAIIAVEERPLVKEAVLWFTDTVPVFAAAPGESDLLVVSAAGYRLGSAGAPKGVGA